MSVIDANKVKSLSLPGRNIKVVASPNTCEVNEMVMCLTEIPQGSELPYHLHEVSSEVMYVTSGTGETVIDDEVIPISVGSTICVNKGSKHTVRNTGSANLNMVCTFSPAIDTKPFEDQAK
jgi:mannose-6-phosphate isomerase-like protein (cupin superfamily)